MSSDLPANWSDATLSELIEPLQSGSRPKGGVRNIAAGVPSIGGEHLTSRGTFNFTAVKYVPEVFFDSMTRGRIETGDVLVVKDGATTGKAALVRDDFPFERAVVNEHVFICRPRESVTPDYLFWFLYSPEGQRRILEHFQGSAQGGINQTFAVGTQVPLAPYDEQRRLVALIDAAVAKADGAGKRLLVASSALRRFRQAIPAASCSGRLTSDWRARAGVEAASVSLERKRRADRERLGRKYREPVLPDPSKLPNIPEEWCWAVLPELGELGRGKSKHRPRNDPKLYGGDYPFIQTGDVARSGGRIVDHTQTYNEAGLAQSRLWPERTVCITIAANIANSALLTYPACFPDSVVGLVADEALALPEYVELFVRTARRDLAAFAPATAQANINLAILGELAVALPPLEEQREITRRAGTMFDLGDHLLARLGRASRQVDRSSQAVLAKAFRGELPVSGDLGRVDPKRDR